MLHQVIQPVPSIASDCIEIEADGTHAPPGRRAVIPAEDWLVVSASLAIIVGAVFAISSIGVERPDPEWFARNVELSLWVCAPVLLAELAWRLIAERPASPARWLLSGIASGRVWQRLRSGLPIVALAAMMPAFSAVKSSISLFHPFSWDPTLIALDRTIHGTDPWKLLQPLMGYPDVTWLASQSYHAWFALIYLGPVLFAFYVIDRPLRLTFFLSYLATWTVVGMVFAAFFASVGPCFVEPILGLPDFAGQTEYLRHANSIHHLAVLDVQDQLLSWYRDEDRGLGRGITAMPSMHVGLTWLYFLACRRVDRRLGWAALAFSGVIFVSSIHLGYHYAVDGYLAIATVTAIWFGCERVCALLAPRLESRKLRNPGERAA